VFRGLMPRIPTFKRDLAAAEIPFEDTRGRRIDIHALRKTYGTMLAAAGVSPRAAMELMRHSDMKLTMGVYTDVTQLPMIAEAARLPSLRIPEITEKDAGRVADSAQGHVAGHVLRHASPGVATSRDESPADAKRRELENPNSLPPVALGHEKAPGVTTKRFPEMERAKRLELSTSTLARWCSTN